MLLSVVIPVYNSETTLPPLLERLQTALSAYAFEVVLVNDGSRDRSEQVAIRLAEQYENVTAVALRRNFGEFNAVLCGLNYARGRYTVIIDDDFQNPPEEILKLVQTAETGGYDVVYSYYASKQHHWFRNLGSRLTNALATHLLQKPKDLYLSSFKLIRDEVVREIVRYTGPYPYIDGLIFRVTRNVGAVQVQHEKRQEGRSNYTVGKLVSLFVNVLVCYSPLPLRVFTLAGAGLSGSGLLAGTALLAAALLGYGVAGWQVVLCALLLLTGFVTLFLGVMSEYLGKLFMAQSGLPAFVVKKVVRRQASAAPVGSSREAGRLPTDDF
ncbi:glycosyltransferase family 2 protein [Tellurirhabdus rosea]|uniref:glycosyltransferase family 2 protein n=1 Tax=Tellurirhabdus rosea TaxID=2674997 RepID=UPI0022599694|nr:glycosyltransferase family 2 protein [Tellurirhabdus rosea]